MQEFIYTLRKRSKKFVCPTPPDRTSIVMLPCTMVPQPAHGNDLKTFKSRTSEGHPKGKDVHQKSVLVSYLCPFCILVPRQTFHDLTKDCKFGTVHCTAFAILEKLCGDVQRERYRDCKWNSGTMQRAIDAARSGSTMALIPSLVDA